jgi:hypothetical protein
MILRAPETEALYEGSAQKGFGVPSIDGSPVPLGSTATHEPIGISKTLWGRWKSPDTTGLKTLWIKKQGNPKQKNINDNQQPSGDKRLDMEEARGRNVLKGSDYAVWILCIVAVFIVSMYIGSWGLLRNPDLSPQTRIINEAYQVTYLLAMSVFSIFAGTLIFFVIKFRARGEEAELQG